MYCDILCFAQHQGFEGSIVAENFSSSDPSSNNPMMHGGLDNGGGLISFHRVSENSFCPCFFPSTVTVQRAKHSGPNCRMKKDSTTIVCCNIPALALWFLFPRGLPFEHEKSTSLICAFMEKAEAEKRPICACSVILRLWGSKT